MLNGTGILPPFRIGKAPSNLRIDRFLKHQPLEILAIDSELS